jgi:hypothetical protein
MKMQKIMIAYFIWGLGAILIASQAHAQDEQWLRYNYWQDAYRSGASMRQINLKTEKPAGVELPDFNDSSPMFGEWISPLAKNGKVYIALDRSDKKKSYDRLYIDSDGDGSLKNEKPVKASSPEEYYNYFGPVKVMLQGEDGPTAYHLNFMFYKQDASRPQLYVMSGCWYEGTITIGTEKKRCVLTDTGANGTFNDTSKSYYGADRITIGEEPNEVTAIAGKFLQFGDKIYRLEVARDGAYIKISPADDVALGEIKLPDDIKEFIAAGENGSFKILPAKGLGKLPEGHYQIHQWVIEKTDDKTGKWKATGDDFRESGDFEVKKESTAYLAVGEPFTSHLEMQDKRGKYTFNLSLTGHLGERISILKGNQRGPSPKLRIVSKDGTFNRSYNFEYG